MTNGVNLATGKGLPSSEVNLCTIESSFIFDYISTAIINGVTHSFFVFGCFFLFRLTSEKRNKKKVTRRLQGWCPLLSSRYVYQIDSVIKETNAPLTNGGQSGEE